MKRYTSRLLVGVLTFCIGIGVLKTIQHIELFIIGHFFSVVDINSSKIAANADEANKVYNAILREKFPLDGDRKLLVLDSQITTYLLYENDAMRKELGIEVTFPTMMQANMPEANTETLDNYLAVNSYGGPLILSAPDLNVAIVSVSDLPSSDVGVFWDKFYKRYPDSSGLIAFSRVGFNNTQDQAFVYFAHTCHSTCGVGGYILLEKKNGQWKILQHEGVWMS